MSADDRTADMALLPAEREMSTEVWAEYGGLPEGLRGYCFRLMRQEADARTHVREAELEVAEWRDRAWRLLSRAETAEAEVARLTVALAQARADRDLLAGLWLATAPMDMLTETLPADRDSRNLLAAVLAEVDLHPNGAAHTDAGRAVIERIVADAGGAR